MSLRFYNVKTKQELTAETEPQIAALWGSSDRSPNVNQGQDMGWRFAPEVLVEMREIMSDPAKLQQIADRFRKLYEDVSESDVMTWISNKTAPQDAPIASQADYQADYDAEVRRIEAQRKADAEKEAVATTTETTTESLADMEKRAELAERIAKANASTTETTTAPVRTTTSTTSKK